MRTQLAGGESKLVEALKLYGFVGPWDCIDGGLEYYRPAFMLGSRLCYARKDTWSIDNPDSFGDVKPDETSFLSKVPENVTIEDGDLVWICTQRFFFACQRVGRRMIPTVNTMTSWNSYLNGSRLTCGTLEQFIRFSNAAYRAAVESMDNQFFDETSKRSGLIEQTFSVVNQLEYRSVSDPYAPQLEQHVERALYYWETRNQENYELVRRDALAVFPELQRSEQAFDQRVKDKVDFLKHERLSEMGKDADTSEPVNHKWTSYISYSDQFAHMKYAEHQHNVVLKNLVDELFELTSYAKSVSFVDESLDSLEAGIDDVTETQQVISEKV